jgi:dienelactone hydrolase
VAAAGAAAKTPGLPQAVYPGVAYREYSRCLPNYLRSLAAAAYRRRNAELAKLTTPAAIHTRQRWARETFWKLIGGMPERTPLNARTVGSFERTGYRVEKILYESRPDFYIGANLYIPTTGKPPFPGVLFQMGHTLNGKAGGAYQRCCQALARLGYLVLAFDPMGQGERVYYPDASGTRTRLASSDDEHTVPGKQMLLYGDTSSRLQVWDAIRSLDLLSSHPLVDPKRLASTGQSGGGTLTMLLACADDRLAAAVVCSGNTENMACANFNPPGSTDDAEQNFIGSGPVGFDRWDLLYPMAPKPLLVAVSDKDFFGTYSSQYIENGWEEFGKLKKVYEVLGASDHLAWAGTPLPHSLGLDMRLLVYNWFARWLKGERNRIDTEPPTAPEDDRTLWVSESGSLIRSFHGYTPFTLNKVRKAAKKPVAIDRLLQVAKFSSPPALKVLKRVPAMGCEIAAIEVPSAPQVWVPGWLFIPKGRDVSKPLLLIVEPAGRNVRWSEGALYPSLAAQGFPVCAIDVRGIGDLWPEFGRKSPRYARTHNNEENYAWSSLVFGKPLLGQRVTDILAVVSALRTYPALKEHKLTVAAVGHLTVPALFAAALDSSIDQLYLAGPLVSFQSIVDTENYSYPFGNFVPGLLNHTDLPEVAALIAPRKIILAGSIGADGATLEPSHVQRIYANASNVEVRAEADFNLSTLTEVWR